MSPLAKTIFTEREKGGWGRHWYFTGKTKFIKRGFFRKREFQTGTITGHQTPLPDVGDEFHAPLASGKLGRFVVRSVRYPGDPRDMFFAEVEMEYGDYVKNNFHGRVAPGVLI